MANAVSSVDVPLSLFSGWNTELSPPDQPEGASPANNDVVFTPGAVATRPGVNRVFANPLSTGPFSYEKSFVTPSGEIHNLYFAMSTGELLVENVTLHPGVAAVLFQSAGATYASSCTAQGREYIVLSDGTHGADIALQYDGTNLWRMTQSGPGVAPSVQSIILPASTLAATIATPVTVASITAIDPVIYGGTTYYASLFILFGAPVTTFSLGEFVTISGSSIGAFDVSGSIIDIGSDSSGNTNIVIPYNLSTPGTSVTGSVVGPAATLSRAGNTVTGGASLNHSLHVGYQVQISGVSASTVGTSITSIVINNEDNPGLATIQMATAHGLLPNNIVNISGVTGATVGSGITNVAFAGDFVTITMSTAHGLAISAEVIVAAVTNTTVNGQWTVAAVPSTTTFTYAFVSAVTAYSAADTGSVKYLWPLASVNPAQNYFTVQTAPTPQTFTVSLSYTDGTWTGGTVTFAWDGTFFVTGVPNSTTFQYQQYGPNATTSGSGTATPYGQATPGIHQVQQAFLLASGAITAPSPSTTFVANGGQYVSISNLAIGPTDVVGRILLFTGAGGAFFYYIPVPAIINGITVSTATQINDNTTTNIVLDFSDNTLYAAQSASKPGNNLAAQVNLGRCAGVFSYASRLLVWGEANKIENLLNLDFNGGYLSLTPNAPTGWTIASSGGSLFFTAQRTLYRMTIGTANVPQGEIQQSGYLDYTGAPIFLSGQTYNVVLWAQASIVNVALILHVVVSSTSTGFTASTIFPGISTTGQYLTASLSATFPSPIPPDLTVSIYSECPTIGTWIQISDVEFDYAQEPYIPNQARISYIDNLTAFDANTGIIGAEDDTSPIRNFGVIRQSLYWVTGTGLHETQDNGETEPSQWNVDQVADNCGAFSIASVGRNAQGIGSAGKDWMMWSGPDGAQIFTGGKPLKISQEIQSVWDAIPAATAYQCWVKNYENSKRCYFGVPTATSMQTLVLDYRNIDGAAIAENPPIHISFTGKMIVSDLTRKWTTWTLPAYCGELMYRGTVAQPQIVLGCLTPSGGANSYILNQNQYFDDDFGIIPASYTTYFFVGHEQEQALQVGSHRHIYTLAQAFISGVGTWTLTPLAASLNNSFPSSPAFPLSTDPFFDVDFGINVHTTRCAFTIQAQPLAGNSYFKLQKLVINMAKDPTAPVRGSTGGTF